MNEPVDFSKYSANRSYVRRNPRLPIYFQLTGDCDADFIEFKKIVSNHPTPLNIKGVDVKQIPDDELKWMIAEANAVNWPTDKC